MSSQYSPDLADVEFVASVLAVRATAAQQCGGLTKTADWKEQLGDFAKKLKDPGVDLAKSLAGDPAKGIVGDPSGVSHMKDVGMESLRNALIGAGVGGGVGAASSLFSNRRKKQPFNRALRGALLGGTLGGLGTGAYRGMEFATSDAPAEALASQIAAEAKARRNEAIRKGQGYPTPGGNPTDSGIVDDAAALKDLGTGYMAGDRGPLETAVEGVKVIGGTPQTVVPGMPYGATGGALLGFGALPANRMVQDRWQLGEALRSNATAAGKPAPTRTGLLKGGPTRRVGKQFTGVSHGDAVAGLGDWRTRRSLKTPKRFGGRLMLPAMALGLGGMWLGGQQDQNWAQKYFGQQP